MQSLYFACPRPNYARWMVRYYHNLINIDETHPGIRDQLQNGALSIRRTDKAFSRTAVCLTLEQSVKADAASRKTGTAAFTTSVSARARLMVTSSVRCCMVSTLMKKAGLNTQEDSSK